MFFDVGNSPPFAQKRSKKVKKKPFFTSYTRLARLESIKFWSLLTILDEIWLKKGQNPREIFLSKKPGKTGSENCMYVLKRPSRSVARRIIQNGNRSANKPKFGQNRPFLDHISSKKGQNELQKCSKTTFFPYYTRYGYETLKVGPCK